MPLVLDDRVVGLLDVYDHRRRDYAEHRDFLLRVGQMMAGAFENGLLMERLEDSNQTLGLLVESGLEFGATLDRDEVLLSVARRLCAATAAPNCDIFTLHGDMLRCISCIDHGEPDPDYVGTEYPLDSWDWRARRSSPGSPCTRRTSPSTRVSATTSGRRTSAGGIGPCSASHSSAAAR